MEAQTKKVQEMYNKELENINNRVLQITISDCGI